MLKSIGFALGVLALSCGAAHAEQSASSAAEGALAGVSLEVKKGDVFTFIGPSGAGKTTTISILPGLVVIDSGDGDVMIADSKRRDIFVPGPNGEPTSMRAMRSQFAPSQPPTPAPAPNTGASADADAEFEALFAGMPPGMKDMLRMQFSQLPRDQALQALRLMRGQMNLPPVSAGDLPAKTKSEVVKTGNTETRRGYQVSEITVAGDRIWVTDPSNVENGPAFVKGMSEFGAIHDEIAEGLPVQDSSIFRIGEFGGFPIEIETEGDLIYFEGAETREVEIPRY